MGPLKDQLYYQVWITMRGRPDARVALSTLNAPASGLDTIRIAWQELQTNGRPEGMTKQTKLKNVLAERSDMFVSFNSPSGHPMLALTPAAQLLDPSAGFPSAQTVAALAATLPPPTIPTGGFDPGLGTPAGALPGLAASGSSLPPPLSNAALLASSLPGLNDDALKRSLEALGLPTGDGTESLAKKPRSGFPTASTSASGGQGYDLVWTPAIAAVKKRDMEKEKEMCRAMLDAVENYKGADVCISMIGFDCKVAKMKKEIPFKNEKLQDVIKRHEDIFMMVPDGKGGVNVKIVPGAMYVLYSPEELLEKMKQQALLPDKIDNPVTLKDRFQALRIEIVHALHRRNGRCAIQAMGQEPGIQRHKQSIIQAKKLQDFVQLFPNNFGLALDETAQTVVTLVSYDVSDMGIIEQTIALNNAARQPKGFGKDRNFGFTGFGTSSFRGSSLPDLRQMGSAHAQLVALAAAGQLSSTPGGGGFSGGFSDSPRSSRFS